MIELSQNYVIMFFGQTTIEIYSTENKATLSCVVDLVSVLFWSCLLTVKKNSLLPNSVTGLIGWVILNECPVYLWGCVPSLDTQR